MSFVSPKTHLAGGPEEDLRGPGRWGSEKERESFAWVKYPVIEVAFEIEWVLAGLVLHDTLETGEPTSSRHEESLSTLDIV